MSALSDYHKYYDIDQYLFNIVTKSFKCNQTLTAFDFYVIITWKSNRSITLVKNGLNEQNLTPEELMGQVSKFAKDEDKIKKLVEISGVGIPIASAILTVCYPQRFTILDFRAWEALILLGEIPRGKKMPGNIYGYFEYLNLCKNVAKKYNMTLRKLDETLWGRSKYESIKKLTR